MLANCRTFVTHLESVRLDHEHALEHLGEISEIESVVEFGWSGQQLCRDGVIDGDAGLDNLLSQYVCL